MLMVLPVLPLLALSGYVTIDGVSADAVANKVTVSVATSAPVGTDDVRAKLAGGVLQLYLDEGHVHEGRHAYKSGGLAISIFKRTDYAKVEVPLAADLGCAGPVSVEASDKGFSASVSCAGASAPAAEEKPAVAAKVAASPTHAAPVAPVAPTPAAPEMHAAAPAPAPAPAPEAKTNAVANANTQPAAPATPEAPASTSPTSAGAPALAFATSSSHGNAMMIPLLLLVAAGAGAFFVKRRQHQKTGMIQILETAQLGPKRQLVVARVNGETMILGSSEAGITCLTGTFRLPTEGTLSSFPNMAQMAHTQAAALAQMTMAAHAQAQAPAPAPVAPAAAQFVPFDPPPAPQSSGNEFVDEGGLLTRLFRARGQEKPHENFENIELHEFDNLLQESIADQELRRKLSSGLRGKVS
jgi:flagellar biogenesis protein FliO